MNQPEQELPPPSTLSVYGIDPSGSHEGKIVDRTTGRIMWHVRGSAAYVRGYMTPMEAAFRNLDRERWLEANPQPKPPWVLRWERAREINERLADMLRQPIANDNEPGFAPQHWRDRLLNERDGVRLGPRLQQRLKRFGRFAEILAVPSARLEHGCWRDMPATNNVATHRRRCCCAASLDVVGGPTAAGEP